MHMDMEEYRAKARELQRQAKQLESEMATYEAFNMCMVGGHVWGSVYIGPPDAGTDEKPTIPVHTVSSQCERCGIGLDGTVHLEFYGDEGTYGSLAGKTQHEILAARSPETSETDEKPTLPVEDDGVYRVDVSHLLHGGDEE